MLREEEKKGSLVMLLAALLAMILIMRGPVTCVGVLTEPVMTTFGIGYSAFGFLCALPIACFGLCGLLGPVVSARTGLSRALTLSVLLILLGAAGRLVTDYATLLLSTVFIATGIAFLNVLMPVLLKQNFPERADVAMGLFTGFIGFSGAIGTYVSVPMWERWGTLAAPFGLWVALSALALLAWRAAPKKGSVAENRFRFGAGFFRNPVVWAVMLVMSMQSLTIYTTAAWLPTILKTEGFSAADAGFGVAAFLLISAPASIFSPWIVRVCGGGRRTSFLCALNFAVGVFLWLRGGGAAFVGCLMAGVSQGLAFSLAMLVMSRKTKNLSELFLISGFAQGTGYVIAGLGPWICGVLFDLAHDPRAIVAFLLGAIAVWGASALYAFGRRPLFPD